MAHYNNFGQQSSFIYSPPGAWIDTPLEFNDPWSLSYHATHVQGATVELNFIGTGVRVFSATVPTPGSYEVYIDGKRVSEGVGSSSTSDPQLLLGSITGLEMGPHTVTLVNSGVTGDILDLDRVETESVLTGGSSSLSTATFDNSVDEIQWGPGWLSASGQSAFHNGTIHYAGQPDTEMSFSFEGDAIAIYGTSGTEMGNYMVTLDGQSHAFNGGSDGSVRIPHDRMILYLANGLGTRRHELAITANPSSLGRPQVFNIDSIGVLSSGSPSGPVLLPPGSPGTGTSSTPPLSVSTESSYASAISSTAFLMPTPLLTSTPSTLSSSPMPSSSSTLPIPLSTPQFDSFQTNHALRAASDDFKFLTNKEVISSVIASAIITGIGLIFFALFMWKRKNLDPLSCIDLEKANRLDRKGPMIEPGEESPELPIQPVDKTSPSFVGGGNPFSDFAPYVQYRGSLTERTRGHSRNGSSTSSVTANDSTYRSYRETLQKRALLTNSVSSTDSTCRDSVSDYYSKNLGGSEPRSRENFVQSILSAYSDDSQYSQTSERIFVNNVRMPPQFSMPMRPPSAAMASLPERMSPSRPPRVRDRLALPF